MLTTHLSGLPYPRFLLIQDSVEEKGKQLLNYVINNHLKLSNFQLHYFVYEGIFVRSKNSFPNSDIKFYDCVSNLGGWKDRISKEHYDRLRKQGIPICPCAPYKDNFFEKFHSSPQSNCVVIIDSLTHLVYDYGFKKAYQMISALKKNSYVMQIVALLHQDLLEDDKIATYFEHLSSLNLSLEAPFNFGPPRVIFTLKKLGGKIIKQVEEYHFENGNLISEPLKKIDAKALVQQNILPENLTTFKISLEESEKKSRDDLVLPYLPKELVDKADSEGKVFYQFDDVDDWDEEDPDDDLDI